jgi:hypothetical protein
MHQEVIKKEKNVSAGHSRPTWAHPGRGNLLPNDKGNVVD